MGYLQVFLYLQMLDLLTTLIGFKIGASEVSPFIRWLIHWGPAVGVGASKLLAFGLAGLCIWLNKDYLIRWITYWYAGLVFWNLCIILAVHRV